MTCNRRRKIVILYLIAVPNFNYMGCDTSYENDCDVNNKIRAYEIK